MLLSKVALACCAGGARAVHRRQQLLQRVVCGRSGSIIVSTRNRFASNCAVVLDIDGVCLRGSEVIPGAAEAISRLQEASIPFMFVTNGGGILEAEKARLLSSKLGLQVDAQQLVLCHTPVRQLVHRFGKQRVLCVGGPGVPGVARAYGFQDVASVADVIADDPRRYPLWKGKVEEVALPGDRHKEFGAVIVFHDPEDWGPDLQISLDVLRGGTPLGSGSSQAVPLIHCNPDIVYADTYPVPRLTCGAFTACLQRLFQEVTGQHLAVEWHGKPERSTYAFAQAALAEQQQLASRSRSAAFDHIFMVGDNPAADIKGANDAGSPWVSVLVRTGVFNDPHASNDKHNAAQVVVDSIVEAVDKVIETARLDT